MTRLEICNLALANIGTTPITGLADGSANGILCTQFYDITRRAFFRDYAWPCALKVAALVEDTTVTPVDWTYAFTLPSGCLRALSIVPSDAVLDLDDWDEVKLYQTPPVRFEVRDRRLYTHESGVYLRYICDPHENLVDTARYSWTAAVAGTNEYYLRTSAAADPGLSEPDAAAVFANDVELTQGTVGSLAAGTWGWGDNLTLGYDTVYIRLSDGTDPDSKARGYVYVQWEALDELVVTALAARLAVALALPITGSGSKLSEVNALYRIAKAEAMAAAGREGGGVFNTYNEFMAARG